jgi:hypothetical protein
MKPSIILITPQGGKRNLDLMVQRLQTQGLDFLVQIQADAETVEAFKREYPAGVGANFPKPYKKAGEKPYGIFR